MKLWCVADLPRWTDQSADLADLLHPGRGAVSSGATGAMAPLDFKIFCFGTHEIIIKVHF